MRELPVNKRWGKRYRSNKYLKIYRNTDWWQNSMSIVNKVLQLCTFSAICTTSAGQTSGEFRVVQKGLKKKKRPSSNLMSLRG